MNRRHFFRFAGSALAVAALGSSVLGCNHKSGRQLPPSSPTSADLTVVNGSRNTLHVYVDGGHIGDAPPFGEARFQLLSGYRRIAVRETGNSFREDLGEYYFGFDAITITYAA